MGNTIVLFSRRFILSILIVLLAAVPSYARNNTDNDWQFHLSPYVWLAGQAGNVSTLKGLPSANVDLDFWDDILEDLNGSLMVVGEARKGKWGLFGDFEYVNVTSEDPTPAGRLFSTIEVETESVLLSIAGFYRLFETGGGYLDVMAGFRMWSVETDLTLSAGLLTQRTATNSESWLDPMFGAKWLLPIGDSRFFISSHLLGGGFGVASDYFWDMNLNFGYRWTETFATTLGYRYLDVDYDEDDFLYDVSQHGPILGLSWRF